MPVADATRSPVGARGRTAARSDPALLLLLLPPLLFLLAFLVVPMAGLLRASFSEGSRPSDVAGFSLQHYARLLDGYYLGVVGETLLLGLASAIISLVLGFPVGYSLARLA